MQGYTFQSVFEKDLVRNVNSGADFYLDGYSLLIQFLEKRRDENVRKVYRGKISLPKFVLEKFWEGEEGTKSVDWKVDNGNLIIDLRSLRY